MALSPERIRRLRQLLWLAFGDRETQPIVRGVFRCRVNGTSVSHAVLRDWRLLNYVEDWGASVQLTPLGKLAVKRGWALAEGAR